MTGIEKFLFHPIVLGAFGVAMAMGLLIIGITIVLFKVLRKRIAQEIMDLPAPGGPDSETWQNTFGVLPAKCPWPCQDHKAMVDKIGCIDHDLEQATGRQKTLREEILPDKFPSRREFDSCQRDRKKHEGELFSRVGALERKQGS